MSIGLIYPNMISEGSMMVVIVEISITIGLINIRMSVRYCIVVIVITI